MKDITHKGIVFDIVGRRIDVAVTPESACSSCKAASLCVMSEGADKIISVVSDHPQYFKTGEQVMVSVGRAMGIKAVALAYIVPFVLLLSVLVIILSLGGSEPTAGLSSLGAVAVYYVSLFFFRKHIESEIIFKIDKIND